MTTRYRKDHGRTRQLARNIRRGVEYNARHALSNGHRILGYKTDESKRYVIDEDTAPIVRRAFAEYAAGKQQQQIANDLNAQGLRTVRGGKFNVHGLRKTLKNDRYIGVYRCGDIVVEGGMPALVNRDTFERVQARFEANKRKGPQMAWGSAKTMPRDTGSRASCAVGSAGIVCRERMVPAPRA